MFSFLCLPGFRGALREHGLLAHLQCPLGIEEAVELDGLDHGPTDGALKPKPLKPRTEIPKSLDPELASGPGSG